jgi:hypothetical protein
MKMRRHHNNDGRQQIKSGGTRRFVERARRQLGVRERMEEDFPGIQDKMMRDAVRR